jgi:hypothetical protein
LQEFAASQPCVGGKEYQGSKGDELSPHRQKPTNELVKELPPYLVIQELGYRNQKQDEQDEVEDADLEAGQVVGHGALL